MVHLVGVFCVHVITEVKSAMGRLVRVQTAKLVLMETAVNCVPTMYKDQSALSANLDTGGSQRMAVKVHI